MYTDIKSDQIDMRTKSAKYGLDNRYRNPNQLKSPKSFDIIGKKKLNNRSNKMSRISNIIPSKRTQNYNQITQPYSENDTQLST